MANAIERSIDMRHRKLNFTILDKIALSVLIFEFAIGFWASIYASILFFVVMLVFATWLLWVGLILGALARFLLLRQWRNVMSTALLVLVLVCALPMVGFSEAIGYRARFWMMKPSYDSEVTHLAPTKTPRLVFWEWNAYMIFNTIYLAYDEKDEFALPSQRQQPDWKQRVGERIDGGDWWAEHLYGHYYLVTTS